MSIFRFDGGSVRCVEFVKSILPMLGNITSVEVYKNESDVPECYRDVPNSYMSEETREDCMSTYHMILRDNRKQEVWLAGCNCGYGGGGPSATKEVLQLVGVKMDYNLIGSENSIILRDITPVYELNIVVYKPKDPLFLQRERRLKASVKFQTAYEKWQFKKELANLGYIHALKNVEPERPDGYYFNLPYPTDQEWTEYATNNALTLNTVHKSLDDDDIENIIMTIAANNNAQIQTRVYNQQ